MWGISQVHNGGCSVYRRASWVHRGMFSTSEGHHNACGGYHECTGECSVYRRDIMDTSGDDAQYIGGYHDAGGSIMIHVGIS